MFARESISVQIKIWLFSYENLKNKYTLITVLDMTLNCILVRDSITERFFAHQALGPKKKKKKIILIYFILVRFSSGHLSSVRSYHTNLSAQALPIFFF